MTETTMHPELKRVLDMPSITQRTPEWYEARHNLITASSCADALGENPYDKMSRKHLLEQKTRIDVSRGGSNIYVLHGTYFEPVATQMYEIIFGEKVYETGLIKHPSIYFIGASPDGLFGEGSMLEIKCPLRRKIKKSGQIRGDICPAHYWIQVQIQLEVCDLERCDFWQCSFNELKSFEEWKNWTPSTKALLICRQPQPAEWSGVRKGIYIILNDGRGVYPTEMFNTEEEWTNWAMNEVNKNKGTLNRVVYWKMDDCFNQPIYRNKEWFNNEAYPKLHEFWREVEECRTNGKIIRPSFYD